MSLPTPAAVPASGPDAGVPAHYGDPMREQRLLEAGRAVVHLPHAVVAVTGADRRSWLDTLSSQRVRDLAPGQSAELMLLDIHGRIEHVAALLDDGERALLITEAGRAPALADYLSSMRFMLAVDVAVADLAVLGFLGDGPAAAAVPVAAGDALAGVWADPWPGVVPGGTRYSFIEADDAAHPGSTWRARWAVVAAGEADGVLRRLVAAGVSLAGTTAWEALRVAAWRPRLGFDVDDKALPHELDWLRTAVHLDKGCYKGQEGVARTFNLGRPPRRVVFLHLDGSDHLLPEPGAAVALGERVVGRVTSPVRHHDLGPVALAVIKRSVPPDAALLVAGPAGVIDASQEVIVAVDGHGQGRPRQRGDLTPGLRRRD